MKYIRTACRKDNTSPRHYRPGTFLVCTCEGCCTGTQEDISGKARCFRMSMTKVPGGRGCRHFCRSVAASLRRGHDQPSPNHYQQPGRLLSSGHRTGTGSTRTTARRSGSALLSCHLSPRPKPSTQPPMTPLTTTARLSQGLPYRNQGTHRSSNYRTLAYCSCIT